MVIDGHNFLILRAVHRLKSKHKDKIEQKQIKRQISEQNTSPWIWYRTCMEDDVQMVNIQCTIIHNRTWKSVHSLPLITTCVNNKTAAKETNIW